MTASDKQAGCTLGFFVVFAFFWLGIIGLIDGILIQQKLAQIDAQKRFVEVRATVESSTVEESFGGEGGMDFNPIVEYRYTYEGEEFTSKRHSMGMWSNTDREFARNVVAEYPEGAEVSAWVDPDDPEMAVLSIAAGSPPAFTVLFLMPFHGIGFFFLAMGLRARRRVGKSKAELLRDRFVAVDRPDHLVVRKPRLPTWMVFLITLGVLTFVAVFPVVFIAGMQSGQALVVPVLGGCIAGAGLIAGWKARRDRRPSQFLHVDKRLGVFSFPADHVGHRVDTIDSLGIDSEATNVAINNVPQVDHTVHAIIAGDKVDVFAFRGAPEEGEAVRRMLRKVLGVSA